MFTCFCTYSKLYLRPVVHRCLHSSGENYSSSWTSDRQSAASQAKKALEGTIAECNSFSSRLAVVHCTGSDEALIGQAGKRMKPNGRQHQMLTVLDLSYARVSD